MSEATSTRAIRQDADDEAHTEGVREAAAKQASKHARLLRSAKDGRILSALMLPFFAVRPPSGYGVITTTGRKTGKPRRKCVRVIRRGNKAYLVNLRPPELAMSRPSSVAAWCQGSREFPTFDHGNSPPCCGRRPRFPEWLKPRLRLADVSHGTPRIDREPDVGAIGPSQLRSGALRGDLGR